MCASLNPVSPRLPLAGKFAFSRILQLDDLPFGSSLDSINIFCYSVRAAGCRTSPYLSPRRPHCRRFLAAAAFSGAC